MCLTKKIKIPKNTTLSYQNHCLVIKTSHETIQLFINPVILLTQDLDYVYLDALNNCNKYKKYLGLYYSILRTHFKDIHQHFRIYLFLKGVGFKVKKISNLLYFKVGYSHEIQIAIPSTIKITVLDQNKLILYGYNWPQLTQFASQLKQLKKVEPYKGKGILLKDEKILRKEGKKAKK